MARYNGRLHCIVGVLPTCYKRKAAIYFYPPGGTGPLHRKIYCDPSSEPSQQDGSDEGSQHILSIRNKKNYPSIIIKYSFLSRVLMLNRLYAGAHLYLSGPIMLFKRSTISIFGPLTHCILVDSSTVICWMSPFVILGASVLFVTYILLLIKNLVSKQCRPGSDLGLHCLPMTL